MLEEGRALCLEHKKKFTISLSTCLHFYPAAKGQIAELNQLQPRVQDILSLS